MSAERLEPNITGIGKAEASQKITPEDTDEMLGKPSGYTRRIIKMTGMGIEERSWATDDETVSSLATKAAKQAIEMAKVYANTLEAVKIATGNPDNLGSPTGAIVQFKLGAEKSVFVSDTSSACPGFLKALFETYCILHSSKYGVKGPILTIGSEIISRNVSKEKLDTFILFGDGAGAVVVENVPVDSSVPDAKFRFAVDGSKYGALVVPAGGSSMPITKEVLEKEYYTIHMDGPEVSSYAEPTMCELSELVMADSGLRLNNIDLVVVHQANLKLLRNVAKRLGIPNEKMYINIQRHGNTSAASIPIALAEAYEEGKLYKGQIILAVTFGAGFNAAAAVLPMFGLPEKSSSQQQ